VGQAALSKSEQAPSAINMVALGACIYAFVWWHSYWWLIAAALFAWPVQWFLAFVASRGDPQYFATLWDSMKHPLTRDPD
jgi:hypothetical protein